MTQAINAPAIYTNADGEMELVTIVELSRGWTTVKTEDGEIKKVRNGSLMAEGYEDYADAYAEITGEEADDEESHLRGIKKATYDPDDYVKGKSLNGSSTMHCGDEVALRLSAYSLDDIYAYVADLLEVTEESLRTRYGKLNLGMQRMNLGNKVRTYFKKLEG